MSNVNDHRFNWIVLDYTVVEFVLVYLCLIAEQNTIQIVQKQTIMFYAVLLAGPFKCMHVIKCWK